MNLEQTMLNIRKNGYIQFDDEVAVISGAGGGLGRVYALELARRGCAVVVNDPGPSRSGEGNSSSPADQVVREIKAFGGKAVANYDSVATSEGGKAIIDTALNAFGRIDILIHNAGILRDKSFSRMTYDLWAPVMQVHLDGAYHISQQAFMVMKEQGYGRIILTTSTSGLFGNFGQVNYGAAKMGLVGLMTCLKPETEKYDIRVNCLAPTALTRMTEELLPPDLQELLKPEAVAPMVLLLSSRHCPANGQIFCAGGGYYGRAAIVSGQGAWIGDGEIPTPEDLDAAWDRIESLRNANEYTDANQSLLGMLSSRKTGDSRPREVPEGFSVTAAFEHLKKVFVPEAARDADVVFQVSLSGEEASEWQIIIRNEECLILSEVKENPVTTLRLDSKDFLRLISGCATAVEMFASGKLKIEGKPGPAQRFEKLFKL